MYTFPSWAMISIQFMWGIVDAKNLNFPNTHTQFWLESEGNILMFREESCHNALSLFEFASRQTTKFSHFPKAFQTQRENLHNLFSNFVWLKQRLTESMEMSVENLPKYFVRVWRLHQSST